MKRVLLPTDFSDNAWNAVEYALKLYQRERCMFFLMNAYTPPLTSPTGSLGSSTITKVLLDAAKKSSDDGLANVLKKIRAGHKSKLHQFKTISKYDFFLSAVKEIIQEEGIDLIVMGTKGASGLKQAIIGSNTASVIGKVTCPVLAIPEKAVFKKPSEIVFATDYQHYYTMKEMLVLFHVAKKYHSAIRVLHALDVEDSLSNTQEAVKKHVEGMVMPFPNSFHTLTGLSLATAIRAFIQSREVDMLCMVGKHHTFFDRILGKPREEEISFHVTIPYLVLHQEG
jgi:nucleotide-binding universal stress UspA family protein